MKNDAAPLDVTHLIHHPYTPPADFEAPQPGVFKASTVYFPSVAAMRREYEMRRNFIVASLNEMGLPCRLPKGSFYVFPRIDSTGLTSREFSMRLLQEKKVAVVPGPAFGPSGEGHVRCSFATALPQIKIAMERMADFVASLRS
jgi:aminotransferase